MRPETHMWLFVVVFMLHEFEEIIMLEAWLKKHAHTFHGLAGKAVTVFQKKQNRLSTASFTLIVAFEFVGLSCLVGYCVQTGDVELWTAALFAFQWHIIVHLLQFLVVRRYTPALITSVTSSVYFIYSIQNLAGRPGLTQVISMSLLLLLAMAVYLKLGFYFASRFQAWLNHYQST